MSFKRAVIAKKGGEVAEHESVAACARAIGSKAENVRRVLRGDAQQVLGWTVSYKDPDAAGPKRERNGEGFDLESLAALQAEGASQTEVADAIRNAVREVTWFQLRVTAGKEDPPHPGWKSKDSLDALKVLAQSSGIDWKSVSDTRTEAQRTEDTIRLMLDNPENADAIFEMTEAQLVPLCNEIESHLIGEGYLLDELEKAGYDPDTGRPAVDLPKGGADDCLIRLWAIVRRVISLRRLVRQTEHPDPKATDVQRVAFAACTALRFQVYCGRSTHGYEGASRSKLGDQIHRAPRHIVKVAVDEYLARHRIQLNEYGLLWPGQTYRKKHAKHDSVFPGTATDGMMQMLPPGHGKTVRLSYVVAVRILQDRTAQIGYVHAAEEGATTFVKMVRANLSAETGSGRRIRSFFPPFQMDRADNNETKIRIKTDNPSANPHLVGYSVDAKRLSVSLNELIIDDAVPQSDVTQPTDRERRIQTVIGTWLTRIRGRGFVMFSGYFWHWGDLMFHMYRQAKKAALTNGREGIPLSVSMQSVGGPKAEDGRRAFESIWEEGYPSKRLRQIYNRAEDKSVYYANFMLKAISDEDRIVKEVAFYDPTTEQNLEFETTITTERHLSFDPSATKDQKTSDKTGALAVHLGDVVFRSQEDDGVTRESRVPRIRVRTAREFRATQQDITDAIVAEAAVRQIDMIHVEVSGGYGTSTRDALMNYHGVTNLTVHGTGNKNKLDRLRAVAALLEAGGEHATPVVEFAGRYVAGDNGEGGHWVPIDDSMARLVDQIKNAKVAPGLHMLDALTQICKWAATNRGFARVGAVNREIKDAEQASRKQQDIDAHFAKLEREMNNLEDDRTRIFDIAGV